MKFLGCAGRHFVFQYTDASVADAPRKVMACDTFSGEVTHMSNVPVDATLYKGTSEYHAYGRSFLVTAKEASSYVEVMCADVLTGRTITPHPYVFAGKCALALDVSAACIAFATDAKIVLLDPLMNKTYEYDAIIAVVAVAAWKTKVGLYAGDWDGNVYAISEYGIKFIGTAPPRLLELHALADKSCLVTTSTHTSVLFETGRCIDFKRHT